METTDTEANRRSIERSAAYPGNTLEESLTLLGIIVKNFTPTQSITRDDIAAIVGKSSATISREVASASHYGLLIRNKGHYQISPTVKAINNSLNENEKRRLLIEAFSTPTLYKEIIEKFDGHAVPSELKTHLIRFHGITENAAPLAADTFIRTAQYCGVLTETNILIVDQTLQRLNGVAVEEIEPKKEKNPIIEIEKSPESKYKGEQVEQKLLPEHTENSEQIRIPLSGKKFAYLTYPSGLNAKDIEILKKQVELLELVVE